MTMLPLSVQTSKNNRFKMAMICASSQNLVWQLRWPGTYHQPLSSNLAGLKIWIAKIRVTKTSCYKNQMPPHNFFSRFKIWIKDSLSESNQPTTILRRQWFTNRSREMQIIASKKDSRVSRTNLRSILVSKVHQRRVEAPQLEIK